MTQIMGMTKKRAGLALAGLAVVSGVWACDGGNLFQPVTTPPRVVTLEAPSSILSGETLPVSVSAVGIAPLDSLQVTFRVGSSSTETTVEAEGPFTLLSADLEFSVPLEADDTLGVLSALAVDRQGNISPVTERIVRVVDAAPPEVEGRVTPGTPELGGTTTIRVSASDNIGLVRLGARVRSPGGAIVFADSSQVSGRSATVNFAWSVPASLPPGEGYLLEFFAVDQEGNRGVPEEEVLTLVDGSPPTATFLAPAPDSMVMGGDSVRVRVRLADNQGIQRVTLRGLAVQDDPDAGSGEIIPRFVAVATEFPNTPTEVTIQRVLRWQDPTPDTRPESERETLLLEVTVEDVSGLVATFTRTMELQHDIAPPQVSILGFTPDEVVNPAGIGNVRVQVSDLDGLVQSGVRLVTLEAWEITGSAVTGTLQSSSLAGPVNFFPLEPPIVAPRTLEAALGPVSPSSAPRGAYFLVATARDRAGNVAADTIRLFRDP